MCTYCGLSVDPLPRWTALADDPEPLVRWLRTKQVAEDPDHDLRPEPPREEEL